ncbi:hypothetical protein ABE504_03840, partial [Paenibacillus oryzisoli]|uniref:hypothetical protein n=1 Tax=Paenibacillus oryzisoli TaxID=1850517 RepID=UPI003D2BB726
AAAPAGGRPDTRGAGAAPPPRGDSAAAAQPQRVFVKIPADREQPDKLLQLKALLKLHKGPLAVALFYESSNKLLALSDQYLVNPSSELFRMIETIMGKDCVRVK